MKKTKTSKKRHRKHDDDRSSGSDRKETKQEKKRRRKGKENTSRSDRSASSASSHSRDTAKEKCAESLATAIAKADIAPVGVDIIRLIVEFIPFGKSPRALRKNISHILQ